MLPKICIQYNKYAIHLQVFFVHTRLLMWSWQISSSISWSKWISCKPPPINILFMFQLLLKRMGVESLWPLDFGGEGLMSNGSQSLHKNDSPVTQTQLSILLTENHTGTSASSANGQLNLCFGVLTLNLWHRHYSLTRGSQNPNNPIKENKIKAFSF